MILKCQECGSEFEKRKTGGSHKFCSKKCGMRNWSKNNRPRIRQYVAERSEKRNHDRRVKYASDPDLRNIARERTRDYNRRNPSRKKMQHLKEYGLTIEQYKALIESQNNSCDICHKSFNGIPTRQIHVDHCHNSQKVRGILCESCNMGIGKFYDNPQYLMQASIYLSSFREDNNGSKN